MRRSLGQDLVRLLTVGLIVMALPGCAAGAANPSLATGPLASATPCPDYQSVQAARPPDGRLLLQAFDSVHRASTPSAASRAAQYERRALDSATNARLYGTAITSPASIFEQSRVASRRLLEQTYPRELRERGIGGEVTLTLFLDATGMVRETRVLRSSGYATLDRAGSTLMRQLRFDPAVAQGCSVPYVTQMPVGYRV
jgi:protein TonB